MNTNTPNACETLQVACLIRKVSLSKQKDGVISDKSYIYKTFNEPIPSGLDSSGHCIFSKVEKNYSKENKGTTGRRIPQIQLCLAEE